MICEYDTHDNVSLVRLTGEVDLASAGEFATLEAHLSGRDRVIFDVSGLEYADSAFLKFLVRLRTHLNWDEPSAIELVGVRPKLRRVLEVTGLNRQFSVWPIADSIAS
jgi:anti-anti-sigma factor